MSNLEKRYFVAKAYFGWSVIDRKLNRAAPCGSEFTATEIHSDIVSGRMDSNKYAWTTVYGTQFDKPAVCIQGMFD